MDIKDLVDSIGEGIKGFSSKVAKEVEANMDLITKKIQEAMDQGGIDLETLASEGEKGEKARQNMAQILDVMTPLDNKIAEGLDYFAYLEILNIWARNYRAKHTEEETKNE